MSNNRAYNGDVEIDADIHLERVGDDYLESIEFYPLEQHIELVDEQTIA